jgi:hypothetical protein
MALLAAYIRQKDAYQTLETYLAEGVFASGKEKTLAPDPADVAGFALFMERYQKGLAIERTAVEVLK